LKNAVFSQAENARIDYVSTVPSKFVRFKFS